MAHSDDLEKWYVNANWWARVTFLLFLSGRLETEIGGAKVEYKGTGWKRGWWSAPCLVHTRLAAHAYGDVYGMRWKVKVQCAGRRAFSSNDPTLVVDAH